MAGGEVGERAAAQRGPGGLRAASLFQRLLGALWLALLCLSVSTVGAVLYQPFTQWYGVWVAKFGQGVVASQSFRNATHMLALQPFVVHNNDTTVAYRARYIFQGLPQWYVLIGTMPFYYGKYLGGSRRVYAVLLGTAALCYLTIMAMYATSGLKIFWQVGPVFGFGAMLLNLRFLLPHPCEVPWQAFLQSLAFVAGNAVVSFRFRETSVSMHARVPCLRACLRACLPAAPAWLWLSPHCSAGRRSLLLHHALTPARV
jgi:hypothetical protein